MSRRGAINQALATTKRSDSQRVRTQGTRLEGGLRRGHVSVYGWVWTYPGLRDRRLHHRRPPRRPLARPRHRAAPTPPRYRRESRPHRLRLAACHRRRDRRGLRGGGVGGRHRARHQPGLLRPDQLHGRLAGRQPPGRLRDRGAGAGRYRGRPDGALRRAAIRGHGIPEAMEQVLHQREPDPAADDASSSRSRPRSRSAPAARSARRARSSPPAARWAR